MTDLRTAWQLAERRWTRLHLMRWQIMTRFMSAPGDPITVVVFGDMEKAKADLAVLRLPDPIAQCVVLKEPEEPPKSQITFMCIDDVLPEIREKPSLEAISDPYITGPRR